MLINILCVGTRFQMYRNTIQLMYHALASNGHSVTISTDRLETQALNLILPPMAFRSSELVDILASGTIDYVIVGIETYDVYARRSRPDGPDPDPNYLRFLAHAKAIWCLFKKDIEPYRALTEKTLYLRYGYHPEIRQIARNTAPQFDVFFFGDIAPYPKRQAILEHLQNAGLSVYILSNSSAAPDALIRDARIANARINLNICHSDHVSPQRVVYLANNAICPYSNTATDLDNYLASAKCFETDAHLVDGCRQAVDAGTFKDDGDAALERVKQWPMTEIISDLCDNTL